VALDDPEAMSIEAVAVPPEVAEKTGVPLESELRFTISALVDGLPKASCSWTVIGPRDAPDDAGPETAELVKTSVRGAAAETVSTCIPLVSPVAAAVIVGVPALVSP
jgi:hypothetical protein